MEAIVKKIESKCKKEASNKSNDPLSFLIQWFKIGKLNDDNYKLFFILLLKRLFYSVSLAWQKNLWNTWNVNSLHLQQNNWKPVSSTCFTANDDDNNVRLLQQKICTEERRLRVLRQNEEKKKNAHWYNTNRLSSVQKMRSKTKKKTYWNTNYNIEYCLLYSLPHFMFWACVLMSSLSLMRAHLCLSFVSWTHEFSFYAKWIWITNSQTKKVKQFNAQRRTIMISVQENAMDTVYTVQYTHTELLPIGSCPFLVNDHDKAINSCTFLAVKKKSKVFTSHSWDIHIFICAPNALLMMSQFRWL